MKKIYYYPNPYQKIGGNNPYMNNLKKHLDVFFKCTNKKNLSKLAEFGMILNIFKADIYYLNWIENVPNKKYGVIRFMFVMIFLYAIKIIKTKKIIWTHHNLQAHNKSSRLVDYLMKWFSINSNYIIAHSKRTFEEIGSDTNKDNILYFSHPVVTKEIKTNSKKEYDILIWGKVNAYKGVFEFLNYIKNNKLLKYKILIVGEFKDYDYYKKVLSIKSNNIKIINNHLNIDQIKVLHAKSRYVVFSYNHTSILNSGALADSLGFRHSGIIGPNKGAFKDLRENDLIFTFECFEDIFNIVSSREFKDIDLINNFCKTHNWYNFSTYLHNKLNNK